MKGGRTYDNRQEGHDRVGQRNVVAMRPSISREGGEDCDGQYRTNDARYDLIKRGLGREECRLTLRTHAAFET